MTDTFDPTKPVQTRDGRNAEVLRVLKNGKIVAVVFDPNYEWASTWDREGNFYGASQIRPDRNDLINIPVKHVRWVNVYRGGGFASSWSSREMADCHAPHDRIACVRVEFTEGQFDD